MDGAAETLFYLWQFGLGLALVLGAYTARNYLVIGRKSMACAIAAFLFGSWYANRSALNMLETIGVTNLETAHMALNLGIIALGAWAIYQPLFSHGKWRDIPND